MMVLGYSVKSIILGLVRVFNFMHLLERAGCAPGQKSLGRGEFYLPIYIRTHDMGAP